MYGRFSCLGAYPETPKPQRVRGATRKVLNIMGIHCPPTTPFRRGPLTPGSSTDEETSSSARLPHKENKWPKTTEVMGEGIL